jgi:hypothetical protein
VSKDAEESSKASAPSVKMPTRPGQGATSAKMPTRPGQGAKPSVVTKEQLAKSGFDNLRDYMNAQKGLTRRDGSKTEKTPSKTTTETKPAGLMAKADKPAVSESYRSEGANKAKPAESGNATRFLTGSKKPEPYNPPAVKFFKSLRARGEKDLAERGMKKGGSINGIAKRGLTKCKTV